MRATSLTPSLKAKRTPLILIRDYSYESEPVCCYCEQRFIPGDSKHKKTWEHLDGDNTNQELWNLMWAHIYCNKMKEHDSDLQIMAQEHIKKNQEWQNSFDFEEFMRERKTKQPTEEFTEIDINVAHYQKTDEFLAEKITREEPKYPMHDAIYCIAARCRKETGHGSAQSIRNYINELCCSEQRYKIEKINGKNYILRRENLA